MTDRAPPTALERPGAVVYLYGELWRTATGHHGRLCLAFALLIGAQLLELAVPYLSGRAINALQLGGGAGLAEAGRFVLLALAASTLGWCLHGPGRVVERNVALRVRERVAEGLVGRLLALPLAWHQAHHSGATAHRVQQSSRALSDFGQHQFLYLHAAVRLVGPIVLLTCIAPLVGVTAVLGFVVITACVLGFDRAMVRLAHAENDAERRYAATLIDALGSTTSLFALRQGRGFRALLQRRLLAVFEPLKRAIVVNEVKWCSVDLSCKVLSYSLVGLFVWLSMRKGAGAGEGAQTLLLGSVYMVWEYAQRSGTVISAIAQHFQTFARQQADYSSADVIRTAEPAHLAEITPVPAPLEWRRLDVHYLSFRHDVMAASSGLAPTLDALAFSLQAGKRYALIGASGSGKSTLLRVLAGLYRCERIRIVHDEHPPIESPRDAARLLRSTATLIPQEAEVFEGSLADNLALCESVSGPPSPQQWPRALELARATEFVEPTAAGLESRVAERGANFSGGQRSRVALARGILAAEGSRLLLLDEPTASLDPRTEARVYANLFSAFPDACIVSSVHRLNLLELFDEVLVMHDGRVVDQGTPGAVVARSAELAQLLAAHRRAEGVASEPSVAA